MGVNAVKSLPISSPTGRRGRRRGFHFPVGSSVEVRTNEKGLKAVYFCATVVPPPRPQASSNRKKSRKLLYVEYRDLVTEENGSEKLREAVEVSFVRPTPPELQEEDEGGRAFQLNDVVDAFYNDGWWMGEVSGFGEGEKVVVTFQQPPDVREFRVSEVRPRWDWVDGIWEKKQSIGFRASIFDVGNAVEVSIEERSYGDAWIEAIVHRILENGNILVEYDLGESVFTEVAVHNARPCPLVSVKDERDFSRFEEVDAYVDHVWRSGVVRKEVENGGYVVYMKKMKQDREFSKWDLRRHMEWKDGKWLLPSVYDHGVFDEKLPLDKCRKRKMDSEKAVENVVRKKARSSIVRKYRHPSWPRTEDSKVGNANSGLMEQACKLKLNDPKGAIDEMIMELSKMDDDGVVVKLKLTKLVELKAKLGKLENEANELRKHVSKHKLERDRIEDERRELLEKLSSLESAKEKEEMEIANLQAGLDGVEERIKNVGCDIVRDVVSFIVMKEASITSLGNENQIGYRCC